MEKLCENVWYLPYSEETDRPNLGYVAGTSRRVMIDAGNSPAHVRLFLDSLEKEGLEPPDTVFLTHHHWDHTFGLCALDGCLSIAGSGTNALLEKQSSFVWDREHLDKYTADGSVPEFCRPHILLEYPDPGEIKVRTADTSFEGELRLDLGNDTAVMRKLISSHTGECYCLLAEKSGVLFIGDANCEEVIGTDWIDDPVKLAAEISQLETMDFRLCLAGHMPPCTKDELIGKLSKRYAALGG